MVERLSNERGYSLVEVMVSILLLSAAIIPMVGMFDAGLKSATTSGDYDKARTFANRQLERAKSQPYDAVKAGFPDSSCTPADATEKVCSNLTAGLPSGLSSYSVGKQFLVPTLDSASSTDQGLMKVTVTVNWGGGKSYSATGVVSR